MPQPASPTRPALRPPLKWAGGKRWQAPHLLPLWQPHASRRLVEPFCGGLAVTLRLQPDRALLSDVNPHLVNFYSWLRLGLRIELRMENDETLFYEHRARFNALVSSGMSGSREAAALFYYLNRTGFNGLCRFNQSGAFNVPFGRYLRIRYTDDFTPYRDLFSRWTFTNTDAAAVPVDPADFIYADPPYDVEFTAYSKGGFSWADQERTAVWLSTHPGPVILVNQATDRIEALYRSLGFAVRFLDAPRRISCNGDRRPAREIMAVRNL